MEKEKVKNYFEEIPSLVFHLRKIRLLEKLLSFFRILKRFKILIKKIERSRERINIHYVRNLKGNLFHRVKQFEAKRMY